MGPSVQASRALGICSDSLTYGAANRRYTLLYHAVASAISRCTLSQCVRCIPDPHFDYLRNTRPSRGANRCLSIHGVASTLRTLKFHCRVLITCVQSISHSFSTRVILEGGKGPKRDEVTGGWRKPHNEELQNLYKITTFRRLALSLPSGGCSEVKPIQLDDRD
jgi:hypothetical protein